MNRIRLAIGILALVVCSMASASHGLRLYVPTELPTGESQLHVVDGDTPALVATRSLPAVVTGLALSVDGSHLYLAVCALDSVLVVNTGDLTIERSIQAGDCPLALAAHPDGSRLFVANLSAAPGDPEAYIHDPETRSISVVDTGTSEVVQNVRVPIHLRGISLSKTGDRLYVAAESGIVEILDTSVYALIDQGLPQIVGGNFYGVAGGPGQRFYVGDAIEDAVIFGDGDAGSRTRRVGLPGRPLGMSVSPVSDDLFVAVTLAVSKLVVISGDDGEVTAQVQVPDNPVSVGLAPDGSKAYVLSTTPSATQVTVVDASTFQVVGGIEISGMVAFWGADFVSDGSQLTKSRTQGIGNDSGCSMEGEPGPPSVVLCCFFLIAIGMLRYGRLQNSVARQ